MDSKGNAVRVVRVREARERLAIGRSTLYRWIALGLLPPLRKIGPSVSGWSSVEFDNSLAARGLVSGDKAAA